MKSIIKESKALTDVWFWKNQIYTEFKDLPLEKMILAITNKAKENSDEILNRPGFTGDQIL